MNQGSSSPHPTLTARCCIVGGGPAGMMLGLLLARAGVDTLVIEKHPDFLRDFRGDTIHPSTLQVMDELGLLGGLLARPHQKVRLLEGEIGSVRVPIADFGYLPTKARFLAFMPQWDFLDFLAERARRYPTFRLMQRTEATGLLEEGDRVVGLEVTAAHGPVMIRADLIVGADGRGSAVRREAGLAVETTGAPFDVLWFRIGRDPGEPETAFGHFEAGRIMVLINRGDYWQCGLVIPKGALDELRARGVDALRRDVAAMAPFAAPHVGDIGSFDDVKLLTVVVDHLTEWARHGLLCIGDAAHAMSPVGGVGVNLAIQDAVATANLLAEPLRRGPVHLALLRGVQRRREWPARITQRAQALVQERLISPVLARTSEIPLPWPLRLLRSVPALRRIPGRVFGMGVRPEHVRSPEAPRNHEA
jgi:2-polyprenyl-6-methoxyphenol hydroxylase-like FAD-dependent oxidoreductase